MAITFSLVVFAWIFFRAENVMHAFEYISGIFSASLFSLPEVHPKGLILILVFFLILEWMGREQQYAIAGLGLKWPKTLRWIFYYCLIAAIFYYTGSEKQFIYFQF